MAKDLIIFFNVDLPSCIFYFWLADVSCMRTNQGCHTTWKTRRIGKSQGIRKLTKKIREKPVNTIKLTIWQSSIEQTSHQCWKRNMHNSGLESHACDFSMNSRKCAN